jgi:N-acetylglucosaminyl-diphospho-decaprenol L-rhamnosyltransferase
MMGYKATLSIVSHGHGSMLHALLRDLEQQEQIGQCLIVITLNLDHEEFDALAFSSLCIKVIKNKKPKGFGANHNAAFLQAEGDWFLIINPDIRLQDTRTLVNLLKPNHPSFVLRAPCVTSSHGSLEDSVRRHLTLWSLMRRAWGLDKEPLQPKYAAEKGKPFYWLAGMFLVIKCEAFQKINGFDSRFFLYCEDYDLCARLYLSGGRIEIIQNIKVIHDAQRGSHRSWAYLRWHLSSLLKVWLSTAFWRVLWVSWGVKP